MKAPDHLFTNDPPPPIESTPRFWRIIKLITAFPFAIIMGLKSLWTKGVFAFGHYKVALAIIAGLWSITFILWLMLGQLTLIAEELRAPTIRILMEAP